MTVDQSQTVVDAAKKKPHLKVMCGFSRRFDASYRDAFNKMDAGLIGRPSVFRSQTCDKLDPSGFFVAYAEFSGGIFVDCSIHDIDLALWFFGQDSVVKSVAAVGITAVQPELRKHKDRDNAVGIVEFYSGQIAYLFCSRMMAAGQVFLPFLHLSQLISVVVIASFPSPSNQIKSIKLTHSLPPKGRRKRNHRHRRQNKHQRQPPSQPRQRLRGLRHPPRDPPGLLRPLPGGFRHRSKRVHGGVSGQLAVTDEVDGGCAGG